MSIDLYPTTCNICGGKVVYCSNDAIYHGRTYGSGFCYLCTQCGAHVGTHKPNPRMALGLLADEPMRKGKKMCHDIFDSLWRVKGGPTGKRDRMYAYLSELMDIPIDDCHFGYFTIDQLRRAYRILHCIEKMQDLLQNHVPYQEIMETGEECVLPIANGWSLIVTHTRVKKHFRFFIMDKETNKKIQVSTYAYWSNKDNCAHLAWDTAIQIILTLGV